MKSSRCINCDLDMDGSYAVYVGLILVKGRQREVIPDELGKLWCESCWENKLKKQLENLHKKSSIRLHLTMNAGTSE